MLYKSIVLWLVCLAASAQNITNFGVGQPVWITEAVTTVPSAVASWTPAQIGNIKDWYLAANAITNSAGAITNLPDSIGISALTNTATTKIVISNNFLSGLPVISVNPAESLNAACLKYTSFTNTQPVEYWALVQLQSTANGSFLFNCVNTAGYQKELLVAVNQNYGALYGGSFITGNAFFTNNVWYVIGGVFNGASSGIYTNLVANKTGNAGANAVSGLNFAGDGSDYMGRFLIAEFLITSNTMTLTDRTNLYTYWKTKYPAAGLP